MTFLSGQRRRETSRLHLPVSGVIALLSLLPPFCVGQSSVTYGASDDASWAIQSFAVSSVLTDDKQKLYNDYIEQCNMASTRDQEVEAGFVADSRFCSVDDFYRIRMNKYQPASVYNYTDIGFKKIRTPPKLFKIIRDFYDANKDQAVQEFTSAHILQNTWESPSTIVRLENETLIGGGDDLKDLIWDEAKAILEEWTGQKLEGVSIYGVREYHRGSILAPHVDDLPFVASAIINVDQRGMEEPWVLEVYGHDGKATNVTMEVGDMVLYESHSVIHGRPFPLQGELYSNVFMHFEPRDMALDHPRGGLPPYVIPGSAWEKFYWEEYPGGWLTEDEEDGEEEEEEDTIVAAAILSDDVEMLSHLAVYAPEMLFEPDDNGWHPLHDAVLKGNVQVVKLLLDHGANINQQTDDNENPLSIAVDNHGEDHEMTKFLLERGAIDAGPEL